MVKLESGDYEPRDSDSVVCEKHGVRTTWGEQEKNMELDELIFRGVSRQFILGIIKEKFGI